MTRRNVLKTAVFGCASPSDLALPSPEVFCCCRPHARRDGRSRNPDSDGNATHSYDAVPAFSSRSLDHAVTHGLETAGAGGPSTVDRRRSRRRVRRSPGGRNRLDDLHGATPSNAGSAAAAAVVRLLPGRCRRCRQRHGHHRRRRRRDSFTGR